MPTYAGRKGKIIRSGDRRHYSVNCACNAIYCKEFRKPRSKEEFERHIARKKRGWSRTEEAGWTCKRCRELAEAPERLSVPEKRHAPWQKAAYA